MRCLGHASTHKKNDALRMNRDVRQLRPGLFDFESSHHKTSENHQETRKALACKGTEVRLTKRTLDGSSYLPMEMCCLECVSSVCALDTQHVSPPHCPAARRSLLANTGGREAGVGGGEGVVGGGGWGRGGGGGGSDSE